MRWWRLVAQWKGHDRHRSAVRSGDYCAAKTTPPYKTCALRVSDPAPTTEASKPVSEKPNRPQSAVRAAEAAVMVDC